MEQKTSVEEHLRTASDAIMLLVTEVAELERHKRGVPPDDPRFEELARAVRVAADGLADFAQQEESWALQAAQDAERALPRIEDVAPPPNLKQLLDHWRDVERRLQDAEPGTPESKRLFDEFQAARDAYLAAFNERAAKD